MSESDSRQADSTAEKNITFNRSVKNSVLYGLLLAASIYAIVYSVRSIVRLAIVMLSNNELKAFTLPAAKQFAFIFLLLAAMFAFKRCNAKLEAAAGRSIRRMILVAYFTAICILFSIQYKNDLSQFADYGNDVYFPRSNDTYDEQWNGEKIVFRHDGNGYRTCPYSEAESGKKIIILGDSMVYGVHLDEKDTLCSYLGGSLKRKTGYAWRVKNLGYPGLGFYSNIRSAENILKTERPDWIIFAYHSGGAFRYCDSFCQMRLMKKSTPIKALGAVLGANNAFMGIQMISARFFPRTEKSLSGSEVEKLDYLAAKANVLFFSYYGNDSFLEWLNQTRSGGFHFIYYNLPHEYPYLDPLNIPYDGHPSARANSEIADIMAEYIIQHSPGARQKK